MRQIVLPIKDDEVLKQVQDTLLNNFKSVWSAQLHHLSSRQGNAAAGQ